MPIKDAEFIAWAKTLHRDCTENASVWQLDQTLLNQFGDLLSAAVDAYENNVDKELRNRASVKLKDAAFAALKLFLSTYVNTLEGNTNIPDGAIESMELRPRPPRSSTDSYSDGSSGVDGNCRTTSRWRRYRRTWGFAVIP
jgi:hypothetical protein